MTYKDIFLDSNMTLESQVKKTEKHDYFCPNLTPNQEQTLQKSDLLLETLVLSELEYHTLVLNGSSKTQINSIDREII